MRGVIICNALLVLDGRIATEHAAERTFVLPFAVAVSSSWTTPPVPHSLSVTQMMESLLAKWAKQQVEEIGVEEVCSTVKGVARQ